MEIAMTDLDPRDRALIELARGGHEPTDTDRSRVRAALVAELGVGIGLSTKAVGAATATAGAGVSGGVASVVSAASVKVVAAVLLTGALGGGAFALHASSGGAARRAATPVGLVREVAGSGAATAGAAGDAVLSPIDPRPAEMPPLTAPPSRPPPSVPAAKEPRALARDTEPAVPTAPEPPAVAAPSSAPAVQAAPVTPTTLDAETKLVRQGVGALHTGDAARALALLDEHARLYPDGFLAEERAGERVLALCDLGRNVEAADAARAFLSQHPRSPLAARVRSSCGGRPNP
jgi:hypothetical protein